MAVGQNPLGWGNRPSTGMSNQNTLPQGAVLQARYEIIKVLGVGGMGAVYLAKDLRFTGATRHCAVKEMIIATPDPNTRRIAMQNFNREANLLVQLSHPGIPKIYDFFSEFNRSYLVMEYVNGQDLETILEETKGALDEATVLDWAAQVCDVLTFLHSQKPPIIFRDLKPANIMLRDQNRIALIDFGIAKAFDAGQKGTMIGTEGYAPPEQYQGVASPMVDMYALGATMHHLLTNRDPRLHPPFTFHEALPNGLNSDLSTETGSIIMKALEYKANNRYPSAQAFKDAIVAVLKRVRENSEENSTATRVLSDAPAESPVVSPAAPQSPPAYPPPTQAGYPGYPPPQGYPAGYPGYPPPQGYPVGYPGYPPVEEAEAEVAEDTIEPIWTFKCEDEVRASPATDGKALYIGAYDHNLYALNLETGDFLWKYATDGGIAARPFVEKDQIVIGSEDRILYSINNRGRLMWTTPTQGRIRSSATMDFGLVFVGSDDGKVYAINAQNGRTIWEQDAADSVRSSPVSADNLLFVGTEGGSVLGLEIRSGDVKWKFNNKSRKSFTATPAHYQDKSILVACSFDNTIYGMNAKNGYELWQTRTKKPIISSPAIYDGIVYVGGIDKNLYAINVDTGKQSWRVDIGAQISSSPAVTETAIYFGTNDGDVISIDRKDRKIRWRYHTGGPVPSSPLVVNDKVYIGSNDYHVYAFPA